MHILATVSSKAISSLNWEIAVFRRFFFFPKTKQFFSCLNSCKSSDALCCFSKYHHSPAVKCGCWNVTELKAGSAAAKLPWQKCRCKILFFCIRKPYSHCPSR